MSCPEGKHEKRAVNPYVHPTEGIEVVGAPPQSDEEPAWCYTCGALWCQKPFGLGWGWIHPRNDRDAPTLMNIVRDVRAEQQAPTCAHCDQPVKKGEATRDVNTPSGPRVVHVSCLELS